MDTQPNDTQTPVIIQPQQSASTPPASPLPTPVGPSQPLAASSMPPTPPRSSKKGLLLVLLVLILAIAGGAAYFLTKKDATPNTATPTTKTVAMRTVALPELDIKLDFPADLADDVNFAVTPVKGSPNGENAISDKDFTVITPVSSRLFNASQLCTVDAASMGSVARFQADARVYLTPASSESQAASSVGTKVGDYYYLYMSPQNSCVAGDAARVKTEDDIKNAFKTAFSTLKTTSPQLAEGATLKIKELGVELALSAPVTDLGYYATGKEDQVILTSKSYTEAVDALKSFEDQIVCRGAGLGTITVSTTDPGLADPNSDRVVHTGGKYYLYSYPQESCAAMSPSTTFNSKVSTYYAGVLKIFKNLKATQ